MSEKENIKATDKAFARWAYYDMNDGAALDVRFIVNKGIPDKGFTDEAQLRAQKIEEKLSDFIDQFNRVANKGNEPLEKEGYSEEVVTYGGGFSDQKTLNKFIDLR